MTEVTPNRASTGIAGTSSTSIYFGTNFVNSTRPNVGSHTVPSNRQLGTNCAIVVCDKLNKLAEGTAGENNNTNFTTIAIVP